MVAGGVVVGVVVGAVEAGIAGEGVAGERVVGMDTAGAGVVEVGVVGAGAVDAGVAGTGVVGVGVAGVGAVGAGVGADVAAGVAGAGVVEVGVAGVGVVGACVVGADVGAGAASGRAGAGESAHYNNEVGAASVEQGGSRWADIAVVVDSGKRNVEVVEGEGPRWVDDGSVGGVVVPGSGVAARGAPQHGVVAEGPHMDHAGVWGGTTPGVEEGEGAQAGCVAGTCSGVEPWARAGSVAVSQTGCPGRV